MLISTFRIDAIIITKFKSWCVTLFYCLFISTTYTAISIRTIVLSAVRMKNFQTQRVKKLMYIQHKNSHKVNTYTFLYLLIRIQNSLQTCISVILIRSPKSSFIFVHLDNLLFNDSEKASLHAVPSGLAIFFLSSLVR